MITKEEVLMGRIKYEDLSQELKNNLDKLLIALNLFRAAYGKPMYVSSGYRSPEDNKAAGGANKSNHMLCLACDFKDSDNKLKEYIKSNPTILEQCGLYQEDPSSTVSWTHLQCSPPKSGNRVFKP